MHRRHVLLAFPVWLTANAQNLDLPQASPVDAVNVYIIPTDGISEEAAGGIARALSKETGLWIKSTLWASFSHAHDQVYLGRNKPTASLMM